MTELSKKGLLSSEQAMILGQLARNNDEILQAAFQVYGMDKNLHELMDTLTRIAQKHEHRCVALALAWRGVWCSRTLACSYV